MIAHFFERTRERGEVSIAQVLSEMLVDPPSVHASRVRERFQSRGGHHDLDHAAVFGRPSPLNESGLFHAVDHAGQAALTRKDAAGQLVHANPVLGLLEMNQHVVPAKRDPPLFLKFGIEDVDQRERRLQEGAPDDELLLRWA